MRSCGHVDASRDAAPRAVPSRLEPPDARLDPEVPVNPLPPQPLSPLDGRHRPAVAPPSEYLSAPGLNRARGEVEVDWLIHLTGNTRFGTRPLAREVRDRLRLVYVDFGQKEIDWLAEKERVTRHDVKAVEYFVRERLAQLGLDHLAELTHFALTSEDVNSTSYALTVKRAVQDVWLPAFRGVVDKLRAMALDLADAPMLSRTHGQPATPTTMGKELGVFVGRLERVLPRIEQTEFLAKFSGA